MKEYKLLDIKEADYGCEERPKGAPLMCLLVLAENVASTSVGAVQSNGAAADEQITSNSSAPNSASQFGKTAKKIYAEIPDALATELGLVRGVIISDEELKDMKSGKKPENWDSLSNRHYYETQIGTVCMSNREFMEYTVQSMSK